MAVSKWFDYNSYMNNKVAQLKTTDPAGNWDVNKVLKAFADAGFVGAEGAEAHFMQFGQFEDVAPNAFFNPTEYYRAKAAAVTGKAPKDVTDLDAANIEMAIKGMGMGAWTHYDTFGSSEKINPSNQFDTDAYMTAKMNALNAIEGGQKYELADVYAAFKTAGINALEHFMAFGGNGVAGEVSQKYEGSIPAEFAVPENKKVISGGGGHDGKTFTLTNGIDAGDAFVGGSSNDVYSGAVMPQGGVTFQAFDQLDGGAGFDTLIAQGINTTITNASTLKNIERIEVFGMVNGATLGLANTTGVQEIHLSSSAGNTATVTGINAGIKSVEVTGNATAGADTTTFTFSNTAVAGAEDSVILKLSGVGDQANADNVVLNPTSGVNGMETINIQSLNAPNFVTLNDGDATSLKTVTVKGDAALNLTVTPATLTKFDATEATGNVSVNLTSNNQDIDAKGGAGDDSFSFGNGLTKNDKIDGAAGKNTLSFNSAGTTLTDTYQVSNIQTLSIADALAGNLDVSKFGKDINTVRLSADSATSKSISKLGADATLDIQAAQTNTVVHTVALADATGKDDKLTVALNGDYSAADTSINYGTVRVDNVETVTIKSGYKTDGNPDNVADEATLNLNAAQAKNLIITGTVGVDLTGSTLTSVTDIDSTGLIPEVAPGTTAGSGGIDVILATAANQTATVKTGNGNNVIVSAAGSDNITTGNGVDSVTIGAGDDTVDLGAGNDTLILTTAGQLTDKDTLKGGDGEDTLELSGAPMTLTDKAFTNVTGFEIISGSGGNAYNLNLGANAAAAFNNIIRIDQGATASQVFDVNASTLTSGQSIDFRGAATGAATADTIVGGGGNDKITGGINSATNGDVLTGGGGSDIFFFRTAAEATGSAADADTTAVKLDRITDFSAGVDKIQIMQTGIGSPLVFNTNATATVASVVNASATNYANLKAIVDVASMTASSAGEAKIYVIKVAAGQATATGFSDKTLLVINDDTAAFDATKDLVIDITGVTGTISADDFAFGNLYA